MKTDRRWLRQKLLAFANANGLKAAVRQFGCSHSTVRKWVRRHRPGKPSSLAERSRRPKHCPRQTPAGLEGLIVRLCRRSCDKKWIAAILAAARRPRDAGAPRKQERRRGGGASRAGSPRSFGASFSPRRLGPDRPGNPKESWADRVGGRSGRPRRRSRDKKWIAAILAAARSRRDAGAPGKQERRRGGWASRAGSPRSFGAAFSLRRLASPRRLRDGL